MITHKDLKGHPTPDKKDLLEAILEAQDHQPRTLAVQVLTQVLGPKAHPQVIQEVQDPKDLDTQAQTLMALRVAILEVKAHPVDTREARDRKAHLVDTQAVRDHKAQQLASPEVLVHKRHQDCIKVAQAHQHLILAVQDLKDHPLDSLVALDHKDHLRTPAVRDRRDHTLAARDHKALHRHILVVLVHRAPKAIQARRVAPTILAPDLVQEEIKVILQANPMALASRLEVVDHKVLGHQNLTENTSHLEIKS